MIAELLDQSDIQQVKVYTENTAQEAVFIDRTLSGLVRDLPTLKIVFEHITTAEAVDFVTAAPANVAATKASMSKLSIALTAASPLRPHPTGG